MRSHKRLAISNLLASVGLKSNDFMAPPLGGRMYPDTAPVDDCSSQRILVTFVYREMQCLHEFHDGDRRGWSDVRGHSSTKVCSPSHVHAETSHGTSSKSMLTKHTHTRTWLDIVEREPAEGMVAAART